MAISDYSKTPGNNLSVGGINIAEDCPPGNINNAIRQIMADLAVFRDSIMGGGSGTAYMPLSGGTFTGNPTFQGQGGYRHNGSAGMTGGRVDYLPQGSSLPGSAQEGDEVVFYS